MSKRKASVARLEDSSTAAAANLSIPIDLVSNAASNARAVSAALLSLLPQDATKQNKDAKKLLRAFTLVVSELEHRGNVLARASEATGTTQLLEFAGGRIRLPDDTVLHIFGYLRGSELVHNASLVCKPWLSVSRAPGLWKRLDSEAGLNTYSKDHSMSIVLGLLARPQFSQLNCLVVPNKVKLGKTGLKQIAKRCPLIETLDICGTKAKDGDLVQLPALFPNLTELQVDMWNITRFGIHVFAVEMGERLQRFDIRGDTITKNFLYDYSFEHIGQVCPNLASFTYRMSNWYGEPELDMVSERGVMALVRGCTSLTHLKLVNTRNVGLKAFELVAELVESQGLALGSLSLHGIPSLFGRTPNDEDENHDDDDDDDEDVTTGTIMDRPSSVRSRLESLIEATSITELWKGRV